MFETGANEFTIKDIEDFLDGGGVVSPATEENEGSPDAQPAENTADNNQPASSVTETQAFAHRLKEATSKARNEERESIAKSLGYESYADMQQKREAQLLEEKGLDPDDISPVVEQLVQKRIAEDPRLKEFDDFKQERMKVWAQQELAELKELTGGAISRMEQVPEDVLELWKTKGSLKAAYIEKYGEKLIREARGSAASGQSRGSTGHLASHQTTPAAAGANKRPFTAQEREVYKLFNPDVTDEQLSKMYKET